MSLFKGLLTKEGPQANLFAGLLICATASAVALVHVIKPVEDIIMMLTVMYGSGAGLLGYTFLKAKEVPRV